MDVREFEDLIDRLGEDMSSWPDASRHAATELLAVSAEARSRLEEARTLRAALAGPAIRAPSGLAERIVAAAREHKAEAAADEPMTEPLASQQT